MDMTLGFECLVIVARGSNHAGQRIRNNSLGIERVHWVLHIPRVSRLGLGLLFEYYGNAREGTVECNNYPRASRQKH